LLSEGMRSWAEQVAGPPVLDPLTGARTVYWYCRVTPSTGGPAGAAVPATYRLVLFAKLGMAVARGTTEAFVPQPAATAWRTSRWALPIDASGVRSDHRTAERPHREAVAAVGPPREPDLLPAEAREGFGNLPLPTQQFLLEPFTRSGSLPSEGRVDASVDVLEDRVAETYWCHLFNRRWLAFTFARRSVPYVSRHLEGADLWNRSREASELQLARWDVAAWTAPVVETVAR
ncbi:MAG TPA: hypothetical protein VF640_03155, partial [Acidimicrobiales bacterium]